jgi:hypothetical protein
MTTRALIHRTLIMMAMAGLIGIVIGAIIA